MNGFTITHNRYEGMKPTDINRDQFWPGLTQERYDELGETNALQLTALYSKYTTEPLNTIVDYGCGDARVLKAIDKQCTKAVGLDICDLVLDAARKNTTAELFNIKEFDKVDYADFVYSLQVMQHNTYEQQLRILVDIKKILKPTGLACIHFPKIEDKPNYKNHGTCMCYTKQQVMYFGNLFSNPVIEEVEIAPNWFDYYLIGGKLC
jgi:SAM-dependent methyltransferase